MYPNRLLLMFHMTNGYRPEPLSTAYNRAEASDGQVFIIHVDMGMIYVSAFHYYEELLWDFGIEVRFALIEAVPLLIERRFFYGFNVVVTPLFVIISAMWWKTEEQPLRIGIWIAGASIGSIIGQAIDFAAVNLGGAYQNSPWKWIYVILGSVSIGIGLFYFWAFPDSPMKARFLSEKEKRIAVQRLQGNNTGIQARKFKIKQVREAFIDPQTYIIAVFGFCFSFANAAV